MAQDERGGSAACGANYLLADRGTCSNTINRVLEMIDKTAEDVEKMDLVVSC